MSSHPTQSPISDSARRSTAEGRWDDAARIWIFPLSRPLASEDKTALEQKLEKFLPGWTAHKAPVHGGSFVHRDIFLVVVADTTGASTSGCSIDSMTREVEQTLGELALGGGDPSDLYYLAGDDVRRVSRNEFRALAAAGTIGAETVVFDTTLTTYAPFREGRFERKLKDSWHNRLVAPK